MITVNAVLNLISHDSEIFLSMSPCNYFFNSSYKIFSLNKLFAFMTFE
jgi:hypothetical protein